MERTRRADPPYPDSLCHRCAASRLVRGRATSFVLCTALPEKYPPQPVRACREFRPRAEARETPPRGHE